MMRWNWNPQGIDGWDRHMGAGGIVGIVLMIVLWAAVIAALVFGIRALVIHSRRSRVLMVATEPAVPETAAGTGTVAPSGLLATLQERYARGDIDRDEFLQRKQDLGLS